MNIFLWLLEWKWLLILSFVFLITTWFNRRQSKLPPGPTPWPIVGNLLQFDVQNPLVTFHQWAKQYGPVYRLYMGSRLNVIINDHEILKNVFSGHVGERTSGNKLP